MKNEKKIEPASPVIITKAPNALSPKRRRVQLNTGPGLTEQSHKDDCDINQIVEKFSGDELKELMGKRPALYGDFASAPSYQESLDIVRNAQEQFAGLPSAARKEFDNDPYKFLAAVQDPKNLDKMVSLGLAQKRSPIDPPASRGDIEKLAKSLSPKGGSPKGQPTGGPKGEDDA